MILTEKKDRQTRDLMEAAFFRPSAMASRLQGLLGVPAAPYRASADSHRACRQVCSGLSAPLRQTISFRTARLVADQVSAETLPGMERIVWVDLEGT